MAVGEAARARRDATTDPDLVTFSIDRNVNYTNFCITDCDFCAFYRRPMDPEGYVLPKSVIFRKIEETLDLGGTALLLQGGHHPNLRIEWYEDLFTDIKSRYPIHLHALSPSEILHISKVSKLSLDETLTRLRAAGHDSLPGGGAEILVDRVRQVIAPRKTTIDEWLDVMSAAHRAGMSTTATMMYGTVDTWEDRIEHLRRLREVQDEIRGLPRLRLLELPVRRRQRARRRPRAHHGRRLPDDAGGQPPVPRQLPPLPVVVGDPGPARSASWRWSSAATTWARS